MNHNDAGRIDLISTHAPAGGATRFRPNGNGCRKLFLLTPLREGRPTRRNFPLSAAVFLLTPLREGRLILLSRPRRITYFYSRPCGRGDNCTAAPVLHGRISTHAPAGGATRGRMKRLRLFLLFLLTPLREGRRHHAHDGRYNLHISTHAPAGGATRPDHAD